MDLHRACELRFRQTPRRGKRGYRQAYQPYRLGPGKGHVRTVRCHGSPVYIMSRDGFMLVSGTWNSVKALRTKLVLLDEMEWQAHCAPNKTNQNNVRTNAHCNGQPININVTVNLGQNGNAMPRFSL